VILDQTLDCWYFENRDLRSDIGLLIFWEPWLWILRTAFLTDPCMRSRGAGPPFWTLLVLDFGSTVTQFSGKAINMASCNIATISYILIVHHPDSLSDSLSGSWFCWKAFDLSYHDLLQPRSYVKVYHTNVVVGLVCIYELHYMCWNYINGPQDKYFCYNMLMYIYIYICYCSEINTIQQLCYPLWNLGKVCIKARSQLKKGSKLKLQMWVEDCSLPRTMKFSN
jgi:hypothetical protein